MDIFANRIVKSLSFIDFLIMNLDTASDDLGVDPSATHLLYRMRGLLPESDEYGFMSKRVNNLLQGTGVSRGTLEKVVQNIVANAHKASSMIENVNSRLRTALNDSKGMTPMYLALLILFINTKEYRRSAIPERKGKSPYELLSGEKTSFMEILFPDFHPVLPLWKAHSKARVKAS